MKQNGIKCEDLNTENSVCHSESYYDESHVMLCYSPSLAC